MIKIPEHIWQAIERIRQNKGSAEDEELVAAWEHEMGIDNELPEDVKRWRDMNRPQADKEFDNLILPALAVPDDSIGGKNPAIRHLVIFKSLPAILKVAACLVLVFSTYYILYKRNQPADVEQAKIPSGKRIQPGGKKAILTLGNGQVIDLEQTGKGMLGQEGDVQVMLEENGKISYKHMENAGNGAAAVSTMQNTISIPCGGEYQLTLSDGSKVWMNAASTLRYPTQFGRVRKVELTGEAYFEVAQNPSSPFYVVVKKPGDTASLSRINVLGTSFNVNAYFDNKEMYTTLVSGAVRIDNFPKKGETSTVLRPGQQSVRSDKGDVYVRKVNVEDVLSWKNGFFIFDSTPLEQAFSEIARWYDLKVVYSAGIHYSGISGGFKKSSSLNEFLNMLDAIGVKYKMVDRTITVL